jgi:hypothetical protein
MRLLAPALAIILAGCADGTPAGPEFRTDTDGVGTGEVSFAADVKPIFMLKCARCHFTGAPERTDLMDPFDAERGVINRRFDATRLLVVPGKPEESFLIDKITRQDLDRDTEGESMPRQIDPLTIDELAALRAWISEGARDDSSHWSRVKPVLAAKCRDCHAAGTSTEPNLDKPFDTDVGLVDADVNIGSGKRVARGDPDHSLLWRKVSGEPLELDLGAPMPFDIEPLSLAEIVAITRWIELGARND